jgi:hypothetical protein
MNGTIYDEIKKNGNSKKKEKLKFFVALISTNLLVAFLCLSFNTPAPITSSPAIPDKIIHPHFKMIIVPLTVLVDIDPSAKETPISLMSKSKKILISRAFLHEEIKKGTNNLEGPSRFKIEIPETEILKLSADTEIEMIAIPELKFPQKEKVSTNKRVSSYEIDL